MPRMASTCVQSQPTVSWQQFQPLIWEEGKGLAVGLGNAASSFLSTLEENGGQVGD